jgi:uncharacterized membrane protein YidH (DUF202 family)
MSRTSLGFVVTAVGVIVVVVAAFADPIGIGGAEDTFGWKQIVGVVIGAVVVVGIVLAAGGEKPASGGETEG